MKLKLHHVFALVAGTMVSVVALTDAVIYALTGYRAFSEGSQHPGLHLAANLVHALAYLALLIVVVRERRRFMAANRFARVLRYVLTASLGWFVLATVVLDPIFWLGGISMDSSVGVLGGSVGSVAFLGMILSSLLLGLAVLRNNPLGIGGRILAAMVPVLGITVLLGFVASSWVHPAYLEVIINCGIALIGVGAAATSQPHQLARERHLTA